MRSSAIWTAVAVVLLGVSAANADPPKSGPALGKSLGGFQVTPVTGPAAGKKTDLYAKTGEHPTILIFARRLDDASIEMIRKLASATEKHKDSKLTSLVILCTDAKDEEARLRALAEEKLPGTQFAVSVDKAAGPKAYQLGTDAELTVVLAHKRKAAAVFAYRAGELKDAGVDLVLDETHRLARAMFLPNIGDPLVAYTPKKALAPGGAQKCETC